MSVKTIMSRCIQNNNLIYSRIANSQCFTQLRNYSSQMKNDEADIVVSGGGLVGCAMALAIAKTPALSDKKLLLLEGFPEKPFNLPKEYANRVVALNNSSRDLFKKLDVWSDIEAMRSKNVIGMQVWDNEGFNNMIRFDAEAGSWHFFVVENDVLVHAMRNKLKNQSNVEIKYGASLQKCYHDPMVDRTLLQLKDDTKLETKLLIGADGAFSAVRDSMKDTSSYLSKSYNEFGVVGVLELEDVDCNDYAWQKFIPSGPIGILPLSKNRSSLVWTLPSKEAHKMVKRDPKEVVNLLNKALGKYPEGFPSIKAISGLAAFPLTLGHSPRYCQKGMVLIGDSAHKVHPMAGQGVNLGFGDVETLTNCLKDNVLDGNVFPSYSYLLRYETERQRYNVPMMLGIDFLHSVYSSQNEFIRLAKNFGIGAVNFSPTVKRIFTSFAA